MADGFADLGMRFTTDGAENADRVLDKIAQGAGKAEAATDRLGRASDETSSATARLLASIERAVTSMEGIMRAAQQASGGTEMLAKAQADAALSASRMAAETGKASAATSAAYGINTRYSASFTPIQAQIAATVSDTQRLTAATQKVGMAADKAAMDLADLYDVSQRDFVGQYVAGMNRVNVVHGKAVGSSKALTQAGLNLSRQFADIGVTAAMGMNPLMILIQQGPQVADAFAMAKTQGLGFTAVLRGLYAAAGPILPILAGIGATVGVVFGAAALGARALNKDNKDLAAGLGLTAKQMEHLKDKGVNTGVTIGDVFKGTFTYIKDAIAPALAPIGKWFSDLFDAVTSGAVKAVKVLVGGFVGAFDAIKATWGMLPAVIGDLAASAANGVIGAVEMMINKSIAGLNRMINFANAAAKAAGINAQLGSISSVALDRVANPNEGAAAKAGEVAGEAFANGFAKGGAGVQKVLDGIGKAITKAAEDRIRKAAGDAAKAKTDKDKADPRDKSDERAAQIAGLLAQAMQEELQARLALTREAKDRAEIEKQIAAFALVEKQAQVDKQIASIADDKGLSESQKMILAAQLELVKIQNARTAGLKAQAIDEAAAAQIAKEASDLRRAGLENEIDLLGSQADLLKSDYARNKVALEILKAQHQIERLKLQEVIASAQSTANEKAIAQARLDVLAAIQANEITHAEQQTRLVDAIGEATDAVRGFKSAFKRHDWGRVFDEFQRTIETIQASFAANGLTGGLITAGSAAASLIGGKGGRVAGTALGIAGAGVGLGAFAGTAAGAAALGATGLGAGAIAGIAALAPPLAIAAAALYAAAKIFNIGGKPSNKGAGYDLVTGAITGKSRDSETEQAAVAAGDAIKGIESALKAAGIGLKDSVRGLVIGTRDQTQIYLQSGKTLLSAVGDSGAAVDTALRALLDGADFVSEAQKKLVDSALAAGKGFDAISDILATYEAAQKISANIADAIQQLTDPQGFDTEAVKRDIQAQRDSVKALADEGYLTADQLATINGQLSTLEGLRLDEVLKRYADAVEDASAAAKKAADLALAGAQDARNAAVAGLKASYDVEAQRLKGIIDGFGQVASRLRAFGDELARTQAGTGQNGYSAAKTAFDQAAAFRRANPGDQGAYDKLQAAGDAFLGVSKTNARTQLEYDRDIAAVRREVTDAAMTALDQVDVAQAQLDQATAMVDQLIELNKTVLTIPAAIQALAIATNALVEAQKAKDGAYGAASNDNIDFARYGAGNKDLQKYAAANDLDPLAFYKQHYLGTGQYEIAAGLRKYAAGGDHPGGLRLVGENGPELEATGPARIWNANDTRQMLGGNTARLEAMVGNLTAEVASLRSEAAKTAKATTSMDDRTRRQEYQGVHVRGSAPGEPVQTQAA